MFLSIGRILLIGVIATLTMDILGAILRRAHWVMSVPPALIGRWVAAVARGQPFQANIQNATPVRHEVAIALLTHYVVGITFATVYLSVTMRLGVSPRSAVAAVTFGLATCVFPWLLMFPAMGFGLFGSRGPADTQIFLSSLTGHAAFGIGIWLGARVSGAG
jgi:Protein of unknown function (DUF2938)